MPFINWARSAGGGLVDKDLPAILGDCALTVERRRKATTVSGGASLELDIYVRIMPRGGELIPFGLTIPSWNSYMPSAERPVQGLCTNRRPSFRSIRKDYSSRRDFGENALVALLPARVALAV